tara:strand:- start:2355 stop:3545 length:1191 start_codon:yes stop_codon:yes gene_type:complete
MAITDIIATVLANTNSTPTSNSIEDAQKYVVSNIPKTLLKWAGTETTTGANGGNNTTTDVTLPVGTDNILSVRRDIYDVVEVSISERAFLESNSGSLKIPTTIYPKYYIKSGNVVTVKPDPTAIKTVHVTYVDFSKIDDDSDLRNIVINYASAKEFTKLASDNLPNWTSLVIPSPPASPNFGNDLTINTSAPIAPSIDLVTLNNSEWVVPTYVPPVMQPPDWSDTENWITTEEDSEMLNSRIQTIQAQISDYSARLNESQSNFNKENVIYAAKVNESVKNAEFNSTKDSQDLQKYQSELTEYQQNVNKEIQDYTSTLNKNVQEYQSKLSLYNSELQKYQSEVGEKTQEAALLSQNVQRYEREAEKYYKFAQSEITQYIQNNNKIIGQTMAAQAAQR